MSKKFKKTKQPANLNLYKKIASQHSALAGDDAMTQSFVVPSESELNSAYSSAFSTVVADAATHSAYYTTIRQDATDSTSSGLTASGASQLPSNIQASATNGSSIIVGLDYPTPFIINKNVALKFNATQGLKIKEALRIKVLEILKNSEGKSTDKGKLTTAYTNRINDYQSA
jgi:hypothetical protein